MAVSSSRSALFSSARTLGEPFMMEGVYRPTEALSAGSVPPSRRTSIRPGPPSVAVLYQVQAGEEVADFKGGGLRRVRAVRDVVADAGAQVVADGAGSGLLGVGGAHGVPPFEDGAFC